MNAFSGYKQIPICEQDEESTAFIIKQGLFCYRVMSFGLKNTGETLFALAFGHETVVPMEIGVAMHRTNHFDEYENNDQMCLNLN